MASHYYSVTGDGQVYTQDRSFVVVGTSSAISSGSVDIELQVVDGQVSARQVYAFLEMFKNYFAVRDQGVIAAGTLLGEEPG